MNVIVYINTLTLAIHVKYATFFRKTLVVDSFLVFVGTTSAWLSALQTPLQVNKHFFSFYVYINVTCPSRETI